jgi:glycosyltransferase involved in cell wall biosynthesis
MGSGWRSADDACRNDILNPVKRRSHPCFAQRAELIQKAIAMVASEHETPSGSLVSVIIPTYNRAGLVAEAIESCLNQTYPHVEVIIVDDGSTDSTLDVLAPFSRRFPRGRFKCICQRNSGAAAARNAGLGMARGLFVKFLDSDDTIEADAIEHYVGALESTGADLCIGARRYMSPEGKKWRVNYRPPKGAVDRPLIRFFDLELRPQQGMWCFRKMLFDGPFHWDPSLIAREDTDLLARMLVGGASVVGAPQAILNQRCHNGQRVSSRQFQSDVFRGVHESNCRLYDLMVEHGRLKEAGRSFARSMCRTALRIWEHDRAAAKECYELARRAHFWPELVLLEHYSRSSRIAAYILWAVGGLRMCGPVMQMYRRTTQKWKA